MYIQLIVLVMMHIHCDSLIGIYGIQGEDMCTQNLTVMLKKPITDTVSVFDITLGADAIFLGMILILFVFVTCFNGHCEDYTNCYRLLVSLIIFFIVLFVLTSFVVFCFGFAMSWLIYPLYNIWKREFIGCSSPVFYIAFAYLTIQYSAIGLIMVGVVVGFIIKCSIHLFYPSS